MKNHSPFISIFSAISFISLLCFSTASFFSCSTSVDDNEETVSYTIDEATWNNQILNYGFAKNYETNATITFYSTYTNKDKELKEEVSSIIEKEKFKYSFTLISTITKTQYADFSEAASTGEYVSYLPYDEKNTLYYLKNNEAKGVLDEVVKAYGFEYLPTFSELEFKDNAYYLNFEEEGSPCYVKYTFKNNKITEYAYYINNRLQKRIEFSKIGKTKVQFPNAEYLNSMTPSQMESYLTELCKTSKSYGVISDYSFKTLDSSTTLSLTYGSTTDSSGNEKTQKEIEDSLIRNFINKITARAELFDLTSTATEDNTIYLGVFEGGKGNLVSLTKDSSTALKFTLFIGRKTVNSEITEAIWNSTMKGLAFVSDENTKFTVTSYDIEEDKTMDFRADKDGLKVSNVSIFNNITSNRLLEFSDTSSFKYYENFSEDSRDWIYEYSSNEYALFMATGFDELIPLLVGSYDEPSSFKCLEFSDLKYENDHYSHTYTGDYGLSKVDFYFENNKLVRLVISEDDGDEEPSSNFIPQRETIITNYGQPKVTLPEAYSLDEMSFEKLERYLFEVCRKLYKSDFIYNYYWESDENSASVVIYPGVINAVYDTIKTNEDICNDVKTKFITHYIDYCESLTDLSDSIDSTKEPNVIYRGQFNRKNKYIVEAIQTQEFDLVNRKVPIFKIIIRK